MLPRVDAARPAIDMIVVRLRSSVPRAIQITGRDQPASQGAALIEHADDLIILEPAPVAVPLSELGEGPCWDTESQSLYWVDIPAGRVHRLDAEWEYTSWDVGMAVGTVVPRARGGLVIAAANGFYTLDPSD